ncbi:uncharacterized protein LOC117640987 [Thrips palmi]|uniref:Uncharacterized protein LOC117640987 n=1 Tax=Thrips palmi TaxID=161013 RepID=A0A6P8YB25_THRPL|nr:uncharacterized protein LOC117640987 [Thrips palmi]XP_034233956.1 uncharacterized protein LOC117640987 [Thrips palmi]
MARKPEGEELCPGELPDGPVGEGSRREGADDVEQPSAPTLEDAEVNLTPTTLEEALRTIKKLRDGQGGTPGAKPSKTAQQLLQWRRRALAYEETISRLARANQEQMSMLSGQLMLLKARLVRKQKDIGKMLVQREAVIQRQQRTIHLLQSRLQEAGVDAAADLDSPTGETNLDSLNDSDSAVIMEDGPGSDHEHSVYPRFRHYGEGGVTVARSVSDAVESPTAKWRQQQFQSQPQRGNGFNFLRRPEVLETVYSVEEDGEGEGGTANGTANAAAAGGSSTASAPGSEVGEYVILQERASSQPHSRRTSSQSYKGDSNSSIDDTPSVDDSSCSTMSAATGRQWGPCPGSPGVGCPVYGSLEVLTEPCDLAVARVAPNGGPNHVTTYNRVMSNHRSVTKPKDVKYKRINKAKSKSLEELRGRLRNWVDRGISSNNKFISLDQSYA